MSTTKPYTPPMFGNFGKSSKDLFKKKYEYNHETKVIGPKTKLGLNVESGVVLDKKSQSTRAYVKTGYTCPDLGLWESEFHTDAAKESKSTFKFTKLFKGLSAKLGYHTKSTPDAFKAGYASAELEYSQDYLSTSAVLKSDLAVSRLDTTAALGYDGLSVGAKVEADVTHAPKVEQLNFGAEYSQPEFTASVYTEKNRNNVVASFFQRLGGDHTVGASMTCDVRSGSRALTLGTDYRVDADTLLRSKADIVSGSSAVTVSAALEHRLAKPAALLSVASEFKVTNNNVETSNYGLQLTLGDF